jgi:hypothetical protein
VNAFIKTIVAAALMAAISSVINARAASFTPGNVVIYRVGDGTSVLTNLGNTVFLDEYTANGTLVQSIMMPTNQAGANSPIVISGTATSEGQLTLSADGQYLIMAGYATNSAYYSVGTTSLPNTSSTAVPRIVGRVDYDGNIDTSTVLTNFSNGNNPRCAASTDGVNIWVGGAQGGVAYTTLGSAAVTTLNNISGTTTNKPTNIRYVDIYNGQIYCSTEKTTNGIYTVGIGEPTTTGQVMTLIQPAGGPGGVMFLTLQAGNTNVDTLYYADDGSGSSAAGIYKFSLVDSSWVQNGGPITVDFGVAGLTASVDLSDGTTNVHLFAVTQGPTGSSLNGSDLYEFTDSSGYNGSVSGSATMIATAAANTAFRGVAMAPANTFHVLGVSKQGNDLNVTWNTVGGRGNQYVLQSTAGEAGGAYSTNGFTDVSPAISVPLLGTWPTNYVDVGGATNVPARYYRVHRE